MPQRKILIVEDDFILYDELCEFFEKQSFTIVKNEEETAVDNYEDAVELVKRHKPDIAILDIRIKGEKDGIDIGTFIKQHYHIPVIYLSAYPNPENLERIRKAGDERFMFKASKPLNKEQLWSMFYLALPEANGGKDKTMGRFFSVKEILLKQPVQKKDKLLPQPKDPVEIQAFFKWDDIVFIESYNKSSNNSILLHTPLADKGYMLRDTLDNIESELPEYFVRFSQGLLINFRKVTGWIKGGTSYLIGEDVHKITDTYKVKALEKISRMTGNGQKDIPER